MLDDQSGIIDGSGMLQNLRVLIRTFRTHSKILHYIVSNCDRLIKYFEVSNLKSDSTIIISTIDLAKRVGPIEPNNFESINS